MARNEYLKMPGELVEYSPTMVRELQRCSVDPIYFIENYVKITHPTDGLVPFILYDFQREMVQTFHENRFSIACASRQVGKSQTSCAFILWYVSFHSHKNVLISSNKASGAKEMLTRISEMYENLPKFLKPGIDPSNWNKLSISFDNNSKIISEATTLNSGRGMSISLLFCDEFAFVANNISEHFWTSISPTLSTGGKCIIASTPNGDDNLYAALWRGAESGANGFIPLFVKWDTVPGRDAEFRDREIAKIGLTKFEQEYECKFISNDPLLFSSIGLSNYFVDKMPDPDARGIVFFEQIEQEKSYIIAMDPATGSGSDYTVIIVYSFPEMVQVAEYRANTVSSPAVYYVLKYILKTMQQRKAVNAYWSLENNGVGEGIISMYESDENPVDFGELVSEPGKRRIGFTTGRNKGKHCMNFKNLFESGKLIVKSRNTISEMKNYIRKSGSYAARLGSTDDTISAHLILIRILEEITAYEDKAYDIMYRDGFINEFEEEEVWEEPPPIVMSRDFDEADLFKHLEIW